MIQRVQRMQALRTDLRAVLKARARAIVRVPQGGLSCVFSRAIVGTLRTSGAQGYGQLGGMRGRGVASPRGGLR